MYFNRGLMMSLNTNAPFDVTGAVLNHVRNRPDAIAVETDEGSWSFRELGERANDFCYEFTRRGLKRQSIIPLLLPRGFDLLAAELAAMKMGACFLPIDPEQPKNRIKAILDQCACEFIVTYKALTPKFSDLGSQLIAAEDCVKALFDQPVIASSDLELVYVIFTSGSTGLPKGVMISRRSFNNFCDSWIKSVPIVEADTVTYLSSPGFDMSIYEIWPALAVGARVSIPDENTKFTPLLLQKWITDRKISKCFPPTSVSELLLGLPWEPNTPLKVLLAGGDRLSLFPSKSIPFRFLNAFGPTEHTVAVTIEEVTEPIEGNLPAIGYPIGNTEVYIVGRDFKLLPHGEQGEIILAGVGTARGYLRAPDQTASRFVPNPFSKTPGGRCYLTGDIGWKDQTGRVYFKGRIDSQVSVRGNRVEPVEICQALKQHPNIEDAYVTNVEVKGGPLQSPVIAYYVPRDRTYTPTQKDLIGFIKQFLPSYMIPDYFVVISQLPLNINGKVDPKLLPIPEFLNREAKTVKAPTTEIQSKILQIWQTALDSKDIGVDENFFEVGGHSLAAIKITTELTNAFQQVVTFKQFFENPTIEGLEASMPKWGKASGPSIQRAKEAAHYPLSFQQEQIVFFQNLAPNSNVYNFQSSTKIYGSLDENALRLALNAMVARHDILRTTYSSNEHEFVQKIETKFEFAFPVMDLTAYPNRKSVRDEKISEMVKTVFDISKLPLTNWQLIKLAEKEYDLILVEHHLVHDGWSLSVVFRELEEFYNAFATGREPQLPPLGLQYRDFAVWQRKSIDSPHFNAQLQYWMNELKDASLSTRLPHDYPRPKQFRFQGDSFLVDVPGALASKIKRFAKENRLTNFDVMFSIFSLLIHNLSQDQDICVGSALANREQKEIAGVVGMFVNAVVIRSQLDRSNSFIDFARSTRNKIMNATMNQSYPFPKLVQKLNIPRDSGTNPIFQTMFSFHDSNVVDPVFGEASGYIDQLHSNGSSRQDLDVVVLPRDRRNKGQGFEADERFTMKWEYDTALFKRTTVQRIIDEYMHLLDACLKEPELTLQKVESLSETVKSKIFRFAGSAREPEANSIGQIFENFQKRRESPCVVEGDTVYTYADIGFQVSKIAAELSSSSLGLPEERVGIIVPRGNLQIAAQVATLGCNKVFVPMDPSLPEGRILEILKIAGIRTVIASNLKAALPASVRVINVAPVHAPRGWTWTEKAPASLRHQLAYILFTSGSTGTPKGVAVELHSLNGYVHRTIESFGLASDSRTTVYNSPGFDVSLSDVWPPLVAGATLYVPTDEMRYSAEKLVEFFHENEITHTEIPTAVVEEIFKMNWPVGSSLKTMLVGGEKLKQWPTERHTFKLYNEYGPTETTISSTSGLVSSIDRGILSPSIGKPINGRSCLVLDEHLNPVSIGVEGRLYISGDAVARGYFQDPAQTAQSFLPNPHTSDGSRMYDTGDNVKWSEEGSLHFCGRSDSQIKIHGFRIELEEISSKIVQVEGVIAAHTMTRKMGSGKIELISFFSVNGKSDHADAVKSHLTRNLPSYMVPSKIIHVEVIPQKLNGKVDEVKLVAQIPTETFAINRQKDQDLQPAQLAMKNVWKRVLQVSDLGTDQNFFDLGGHSLLLADLQRQVQAEFDVKIPLVAFFEFTSVDRLVRHLSDLKSKGSSDYQKAVDAGKTKLNQPNRLVQRRRKA